MNRSIEKIHRCYLTIREILKDRGYVEDEDDPTTKRQIRYAEDIKYFKKALVDLNKEPQRCFKKLRMLRHHAMFDKPIYVFFVGAKIGVANVNHYSTIMSEHNPPVHHAILVSVFSEAVLTPFADVRIRALKNEEGQIIEHFYLSQLLINIKNHELQPPKIEICTPEEKEEILKGYKLKETQLHWIVESDPLSKYFGLQPKDMLKITRYSETTGKAVLYRICVPDTAS